MCACESFSAQGFSARYSKGDLSVGTELVHAVGIMPTGSLHWFDWSQSGRFSDPLAVILLLLAESAWCTRDQGLGILRPSKGIGVIVVAQGSTHVGRLVCVVVNLRHHIGDLVEPQ